MIQRPDPPASHDSWNDRPRIPDDIPGRTAPDDHPDQHPDPNREPHRMTISAEERRTINRQNSRASTGPKSDRGKQAVSLNAFKHGMRSEKLVLPHEDH